MSLLLLQTAMAYETGASWSDQIAPIEAPFELNIDSFEPLAPAADVEAAFTEALDTWSIESGGDVYLRYGGPTDLVQQGVSNGRNTSVYGGGTFFTSLAVATSTTMSGQMVDCDIRFYRSNLYGVIDWHVGEDTAPSGALDLRHTMIHEVGHCIGLNHSNVSDAIMAPTNSSGTGDERRHLTPDDIAGAQALYGVVDPLVGLEEARLDASDSTLTVALRNTGTGTAWLLEVDLQAGPAGSGFVTGLPESPAYIEAIGAPTPVGAAVAAEVVEVVLPVELGATCIDQVPQPASLDIVVRDVNGVENRFPIVLDATCSPDPSDPGDSDDPAAPEASEMPGGCGCSSAATSPVLAGLALLPLLLLARRRW